MSIKVKLLEDIKAAMKEKKAERLEALRFLNASIKNREIEIRPETITDADILAVVQKMVKQRNDSIDQFKKAGRDDLASKEESELLILKEYLPTQLSESEVKSIVDAAVASVGATSIKDMGKVMKEAQDKAQGRADNKLLSQYVKDKLSAAAQ